MRGRTREENKCRRRARSKESGYERKTKPAKRWTVEIRKVCLSEPASHFPVFHRASLKINKSSSSIYHMTEESLACGGSASL